MTKSVRSASKAKTASKDRPALIPNQLLRRLYTAILRCRVAAPHVAARLRGRNGGKRRPALREAALVARIVPEVVATLCLRRKDTLLAAGFASTIARGGSLAEAVRAAETAFGSRSTSHTGCGEIAAAEAFAARLQGKERIVFTLLGACRPDDAFRRLLSCCGQARIPLILFVESELQPAASRSKRPARHSASSGSADFRSLWTEFGVPVITSDVNDPVALYRVTTEAIHHAHFGRGTTLIETTRIIAHGRAAKARGIVSAGDPLELLERCMRARGCWNAAWAQAQRSRAEQELRP